MPPLGDFALDAEVVAVTGAGRGIGKAIALDVARSGGLVSACSRNSAELDDLAAEISENGGTCATICADVTSTTEISRFVRHTVESFGRISCLVNNAGHNLLKDALEYTEDEVDHIIGINLKSVFFGCTLAAQEMIRQGSGGSIVNISSQAGVVGAPRRAPYSAAKAGVNNLTRTLAAEWAVHSIRVNAVAPTVTMTPLASKAMEEQPDFAREVGERILLGRPAEVREISEPVVFLLSKAASMITGHTLIVDGGWTIV